MSIFKRSITMVPALIMIIVLLTMSVFAAEQSEAKMTINVIGEQVTETYDGQNHVATHVSFMCVEGNTELYAEDKIVYTPKIAESINLVTKKAIGYERDDFSYSDASIDVTFNVTDGWLTVEPKAVTVKADKVQKIYGEADPELTATIEGLVNGEPAEIIEYIAERESGEDIGDYKITVSGDTYQGNYVVTYESGTFTVFAPEVVYIGADQTAKTLKEPYTIIDSTNKPAIWSEGWYVVQGTADYTEGGTKTGGITCNGAVHLILTDGCALSVTGGNNKAGIRVSGDANSLAIYGQSGGTGKLDASGVNGGAGIGGNMDQSGNNITINGGTVTATGCDGGAGIGGGNMQSGNNITINGGTVTAEGGLHGAGIGGGFSGAGRNITINGGTVTSKGGVDGAGIGGGCIHNGSNITINGGTVKAVGGQHGAGIGGGYQGSGSNITINGGCIKATGSDGGENIGSGYSGGTASGIVLKGGCYTNKPDSKYIPSGYFLDDNTETSTKGSYPYAISQKTACVYLDENGKSKSCTDYTVINKYNMPTTWSAGWYVVQGTVNYPDGGITCSGDVHLILTDGCALSVYGGMHNAGICVSGDSNSLTIYGQSGCTGKLEAKGVAGGAGIGGNKDQSGNNITINGGEINAQGFNMSAGIGGGLNGSGSNITINGGYINAKGTNGGASIGGGDGGTASDIVLKGGCYTNKPDSKYIPIGYFADDNTDTATKTDYPYSIQQADSNLVLDGYYPGAFSADGEELEVVAFSGHNYLKIPNGAKVLTYYEYQKGAEAHTTYPLSMKVWLLSQDAGSGEWTATALTELDNLLTYCGTSIRTTGNRGVRVITEVDEALKKQLIAGLGGYTLSEYGTVMAWTEKLNGASLTLDNPNAVSNYAYSKANHKDPVFKRANGKLQYTNILMLSNMPDTVMGKDITMRPYMKLTDAQGNGLVIYGGEVERSVGYVAYQNRNAFKPGTSQYEYIWSIIRLAYGTAYDSEYISK